MLSESLRAGLQAGAESLARKMKLVATLRTRKTAQAVNIRYEGDEAVIAGGHAGGAYGWEPIQALMFDNDKRHPLFGHDPWYHQGDWPITAITAREGAGDAAEAFADAALEVLYREHGFIE